MTRRLALLVSSAVFAFTFSSRALATTESWYWQFALGYAVPQYPSAVKSAIDSAKSSGSSSLPIAVDLGFYWPLGVDPMTVLGVSINGDSDQYSSSSLLGSFSIIQTGIYFSAIHSFGDEPGHGFFLRGDIGIARVAVSSNLDYTATSNMGFGAGIFTGYGIMIGQDTRLVFGANYSYRHVEGYNYGELAFTVGPMF